MDWKNVKIEEDCVEIATVDAYDEYEQASGWFCCLEEIFGHVKFVKVFGEKVKLKRLELEDTEILAVCEKKR